MQDHELDNLSKFYEKNGYVSPVKLLSEAEAAKHRNRLEEAEKKLGSLHYRSKVHTILTSPFELATSSKVLDLIEKLIGPNILLYNVTYIIKEPNSPDHVSWHQDLTYWGLSHDDQVSMWLALSPATKESGCMRMIPESHKNGQLNHETTNDESNVLYQGQTVRDINENESCLCPLCPGEATFHHGWTLHASTPNHSNDRRIGLNVQYLATHVSQKKHDNDSVILVRGEDTHQNFNLDVPAKVDLDADALNRQLELEKLYIETAGRK